MLCLAARAEVVRTSAAAGAAGKVARTPAQSQAGQPEAVDTKLRIAFSAGEASSCTTSSPGGAGEASHAKQGPGQPAVIRLLNDINLLTLFDSVRLMSTPSEEPAEGEGSPA